MANGKPVDPGLVRELAEILRENDLSGIEVEADEVHIKLSRTANVVASSPQPAPVAPVAQPVAPASSPAPQSPSSASAAAVAPAKGTTVPSPMVGTAYLSPTPGARPFVSEGETVNEGDTLLIIEAMKVMNQIPAPRAGKVTSIMCENGQPVEYDQPLMIIE